MSDEPGRPDVYVHAGAVNASACLWPAARTRDGRAMAARCLFLRGSTLMRADLNDAAGRFEAPHPLFDVPGIRDFDVAHRSDRIVALLPVQAEPVEQRAGRAELAVALCSGRSERPKAGTRARTCRT